MPWLARTTNPKVYLLGEGFYGNGIVAQGDLDQMIANLRGDPTGT